MSIVMKEAFQNQRNKKGNRISAIPLLFLVAGVRFELTTFGL
jgi:hypothetical protein